MKPFTEEEFACIEDALRTGRDCYWAFNKLACKLRLEFTFYGVDLYNALQFLQGAKDHQLKNESNYSETSSFSEVVSNPVRALRAT